MSANDMTLKERKMATYFMKVALLTAKLSYAKRAKVGAVLVNDNRIIAVGYNGRVCGDDNCCEHTMPDGSLVTRDDVVHAEANLLAYTAKTNIIANESDVYVTLSPCYTCALLMLQSGIRRVFYYEKYRKTDAIDFLNSHGIECIEFNDKDFYEVE